MTQSERPRIVAHRGYSSKAPENTLASVKKAVEVGADGVEWDIYTASCGTPILFHDSRLGRTTDGVGPVGRRTVRQLKALDAGSWFSEEFAGEPIPTLAEACEVLGESTLGLVAEIKGWRELEDVDRMVRVIQDAGILDRTRFISMDWTTLDRVRRNAPEAAVSLIVEKAERLEEAITRASDMGNAGLAIDYRFLVDGSPHMQTVKASGLTVGVWTLDDPAFADELVDHGVLDLTTNEVEALQTWRRTRESSVE